MSYNDVQGLTRLDSTRVISHIFFTSKAPCFDHDTESKHHRRLGAEITMLLSDILSTGFSFCFPLAFYLLVKTKTMQCT